MINSPLLREPSPRASTPRPDHTSGGDDREIGSAPPTKLAISFHGGGSGPKGSKAVNNILVPSASGSTTHLLGPNQDGFMPALWELRGFFADPTSGDLFVVNAYKDCSAIFRFTSSAGAATPYRYAGIFAAGPGAHLNHPFCAALGPDGDVYVSNQDPEGGRTSGAITVYQGSTTAVPGTFVRVFADGFTALRAIATDGVYWYAADAGSTSTPGGVQVFDQHGAPQPQGPLNVPQPVHLLYDGARYLYIGSEAKNSVYRYDTTRPGDPDLFVDGSRQIDHTSGLAISSTALYVASRKGRNVYRYPLADPTSGQSFVTKLPDYPEFLSFL